jgi:hypothetical protein
MAGAEAGHDDQAADGAGRAFREIAQQCLQREDGRQWRGTGWGRKAGAEAAMTVRPGMAPDGRFAKSRNNACNVRMGGNGGDRFGADGWRGGGHDGPARDGTGRTCRDIAQQCLQREDGWQWREPAGGGWLARGRAMTVRPGMAPDGRFAKSRNNACNVRMGGNGGNRLEADSWRGGGP